MLCFAKFSIDRKHLVEIRYNKSNKYTIDVKVYKPSVYLCTLSDFFSFFFWQYIASRCEQASSIKLRNK